MDDADHLASCRRCDWPLVGNESYCSNCGRRVDDGIRSPRAILGILCLLLALVGTGTCLLRSRHLPPPLAFSHTNPAR